MEFCYRLRQYLCSKGAVLGFYKQATHRRPGDEHFTSWVTKKCDFFVSPSVTKKCDAFVFVTQGETKTSQFFVAHGKKKRHTFCPSGGNKNVTLFRHSWETKASHFFLTQGETKTLHFFVTHGRGERNRYKEFRFRFRHCRYRNSGRKKKRKICNSLNWFKGVSFSFWIKMHSKNIFPKINSKNYKFSVFFPARNPVPAMPEPEYKFLVPVPLTP